MMVVAQTHGGGTACGDAYFKEIDREEREKVISNPHIGFDIKN